MPWAGDRLIGEGGIYYVGMATRGEFWADNKPHSFDARLQVTKACVTGRDGCQTPFRQFLDALTWALFGAPLDETNDRWGWSNLLKIGWSEGNPDDWPQKLKDDQEDTCAESLREEFEQLHHSLVVIASADPRSVLDHLRVFPQLIPNWKPNFEDNWHKHYHKQTGLYWFKDQKSANLFVWGNHPGYSVARGEWGSALGRTIQLARALMPRFACFG